MSLKEDTLKELILPLSYTVRSFKLIIDLLLKCYMLFNMLHLSTSGTLGGTIHGPTMQRCLVCTISEMQLSSISPGWPLIQSMSPPLGSSWNFVKCCDIYCGNLSCTQKPRKEQILPM